MVPEEKLLFACARQDFNDSFRTKILELVRRGLIRWDLVYQLAELHGVAPLIYRNIRGMKEEIRLPNEIAQKFEFNTMENVILKEKRAAKLVDALAFFQSKSIDVLLVKGAALDLMVYDFPWYTFSKDMDLIIHCRTDRLSEVELSQFKKRMYKTGLEYDFFEHHDININGVLPVDFTQIWEDSREINFRGHKVFLMSVPDLLISVCINSSRKRFLRLKLLTDIAETIGKYPEMDWGSLIKKSRDYGCGNILYTALLAAKLTVGCLLPENLLHKLITSSVKRLILTRTLRFLLSGKPLINNTANNGLIFGRPFGQSLLLPYLTYDRHQLMRKVNFVFNSRR